MKIPPNFAVIYRFYLLPSKEEEYVSNWKIITNYFVEHRGAISSTLHKTEEGYWVAYSKWTDRKTRDASWIKDGVQKDLPGKIQHAIEIMQNCSDPQKEPFPELCLNIIEHTEGKK